MIGKYLIGERWIFWAKGECLEWGMSSTLKLVQWVSRPIGIEGSGVGGKMRRELDISNLPYKKRREQGPGR